MRRSYIVKGGAGHDDDIAESPSHLEFPHLGARQKKNTGCKTEPGYRRSALAAAVGRMLEHRNQTTYPT